MYIAGIDVRKVGKYIGNKYNFVIASLCVILHGIDIYTAI